MRSTKLLRILLSLQSLTVRGFEFDDTGVVLEVVPRGVARRCGECGAKANRVKDRRPRKWRHLDLAGLTVHLRYSIWRVHCDQCHGVKTEQVPWAESASRFTYAFEERTAYLAQQASKTVVADFLRIAWRTVGMVIRRVVERDLEKRGDRLEGLRHIGVDELSYRRHHEYVTVVVDHERGTVVWSSKGKNAETLRAFFEELGPERCALLESATIDMSAAYISAVTQMAPNARLVHDRFHVQRLVQDALDETRRDEVRGAGSPEERRALKGTRWALQKSEWNLTDSERQTLDELEDSNRPLYRGHLLKELFAQILAGKQVNVAQRRIVAWIAEAKASGLPRFARTANTIEKHLDGILEYIRTRFSNGRVEGLNGKIRTITRRAFGFHSARSLIAMIFLCCGGVKVTPAFARPQATH